MRTFLKFLYSPRVFKLHSNISCCNCSRFASTSPIVGRSLGSELRHWRMIEANLCASSISMFLAIFLSIMLCSSIWLLRCGLAHVARSLIVPSVYFLTATQPQNNSSSTTPKLYKSVFSVKCRVNCT